MRLHTVLWAAVILACGQNESANQNADSGSGGGGPTLRALTVAVSGSGKVMSAPAGIDCGSTCSAQFAEGMAVALSAQPASGWALKSWSGGCSGTGNCSVTLNADVEVGAAFEQLPGPPPQTFAQSVAVQGSGSVTSAPAGIDCGSTCSARFAAGTQIALIPAATSGWKFAGWTGACSGAQGCSVTLNADVAVGAAFEQLPPPDECAGLAPASLPDPVIAVLRDHSCLNGTSDDVGNFLLGFNFDGAITIPEYWFFTLQDGQPRHIGETVVSDGDYVASSQPVFSQPSGFTAVRHSRSSSSVISYSHDGILTSTMSVSHSLVDENPQWLAIAVDPDGGTALVRTTSTSSAGQVSEYQRLDKRGVPETGWVLIDSGPNSVNGFGVALSGDILFLESQNSSIWRARWIARDGTPLTGWFFATEGSGTPELQFLMDGSLVLRFRSWTLPFDLGPWRARFEDGKDVSSPVPVWLAQRPGNSLYAIRNGAAYATWGPGRQCGDGLEVVAASGKSCGCLQVPFLGEGPDYLYGSWASVGRDGSLIVPNPPNGGACQYHLYPRLLR